MRPAINDAPKAEGHMCRKKAAALLAEDAPSRSTSPAMAEVTAMVKRITTRLTKNMKPIREVSSVEVTMRSEEKATTKTPTTVGTARM
jgi:hypothetical protein